MGCIPVFHLIKGGNTRSLLWRLLAGCMTKTRVVVPDNGDDEA
jgi:hypothetical protein